MPAARKLRPLALNDLDGQTAKLVREVQERSEPIVLTHAGNRLAVVLPLEEFERMQAEADRIKLQRAVDEADARMDNGEFVSNDEVMAQLDRWIADED